MKLIQIFLCSLLLTGCTHAAETNKAAVDLKTPTPAKLEAVRAADDEFNQRQKKEAVMRRLREFGHPWDETNSGSILLPERVRQQALTLEAQFEASTNAQQRKILAGKLDALVPPHQLEKNP